MGLDLFQTGLDSKMKKKGEKKSNIWYKKEKAEIV